LLAQELNGSVTAAVVDKHDLIRLLQRIQCLVEAREELRQYGFLVENGYDD
jgi:hypothetical protein